MTTFQPEINQNTLSLSFLVVSVVGFMHGHAANLSFSTFIGFVPTDKWRTAILVTRPQRDDTDIWFGAVRECPQGISKHFPQGNYNVLNLCFDPALLLTTFIIINFFCSFTASDLIMLNFPPCLGINHS